MNTKKRKFGSHPSKFKLCYKVYAIFLCVLFQVRYRVVIPSMNKKGVTPSIPTMDLEGTSRSSHNGRKHSLVQLTKPGTQLKHLDPRVHGT